MFGNPLLNMARFGQPRSREQIIQYHNDFLKDLTRSLTTKPHHVQISNSRLAKPASFGRPPPFNSCRPVLCSELQLDAVHKGQVLTGKLVVDALLMSSLQTVLEDEAGDVMQLFLYNTPQLRRYTPASSPADISAAQKVFPQGQQLAILEPYYKVMTDGTLGVRVDNPAEVIFLDASGCPIEAPPETAADSSSSSSSSSSASGSSSTAESKPCKPQRPNKKKVKGRKK